MDRGAWWAVYSPWGWKESDTTEEPSMHAATKTWQSQIYE